MVSRVFAVTPPSVPDVGDGRMKAFGFCDQAGHARLVAEDRAAGALRGRIDGQHRDAVAGGDQVHAELVDGGRLADAGHAGDADAVRLAGIRQQLLQQVLGESWCAGLVLSTSVMARASIARSPARMPATRSGRAGSRTVVRVGAAGLAMVGRWALIGGRRDPQSGWPGRKIMEKAMDRTMVANRATGKVSERRSVPGE